MNKSLLQSILNYEYFYILGHEQPDGDCLSSQIGFFNLIKTLGKEGVLINKGPFSRPEISDLEDRFSQDFQFIEKKSLAVLLDCSSVKRTGYPELIPFLKENKIDLLIVDHHQKSIDQLEADFSYINPEVPSTTILVQNLWNAFNLPIDKETAQWLFLGFSTDTGFFRHLTQKSAQFIHDAAQLVDCGASPGDTFKRISSGRSLGTRKLMGKILDRSESFFDGKVILSWEDAKDREELKTDDRDSDKLYQLLQSIEGCEVVVLLRETENKEVIIGLRSNNTIDVSRVASSFGGGGHKKASGCAIQNSLKQAKKLVLAELSKQLP